LTSYPRRRSLQADADHDGCGCLVVAFFGACIFASFALLGFLVWAGVDLVQWITTK